MQNFNKKLIAASKNGNFLEEVYQAYLDRRDDRSLVAKVIAALHNEGSIDVVAEFSQLSKKAKGTDFFITRRIFEEVLPELNSPVFNVMKCVIHLVKEAGQDGAATLPYSAFQKYCEADSNRPKEVLKIILDTPDDECLDCLTFALWAGIKFDLAKYANKAIKLLTHKNLEIQTRVAYAVGHIDCKSNDKLIEKAFKSLEQIAKKAKDENLIRNIMLGSISLFLQNKKLQKRLISLQSKLLDDKNKILQFTSSEILFRHHKELPEELVLLMLSSLWNINSEHTGILNNLDSFLYDSLTNNNKTEQITDFLECFLIKSEGVSINIFDSFAHELYHSSHTLLNQLATRWFLSGKYELCKAIFHVMKQGHGNGIELFVDKNELSKCTFENVYFFLSKKAIGWLYTEPVTATSFILSLLKVAPKDEAEIIKELLFHPLLISYSGNVRDYLKKMLPKSKKNRKFIQYALDKLDKYHEGLKQAYAISELLPSQEQKEIYHRCFSRQMNDAFKEAQKHSIINQIAHKTVLLYGRESIFYTDMPDGKSNRISTPLQEVGTTIEFPSLPSLDPHGIEYMLCVFRNERYV